jgi:phospholipid/cholesterol/gamma-HCH transport system permease protein
MATTRPHLAPAGDTRLLASGAWTVEHADALRQLTAGGAGTATAIDAGAIERLDTLGALRAGTHSG